MYCGVPSSAGPAAYGVVSAMPLPGAITDIALGTRPVGVT